MMTRLHWSKIVTLCRLIRKVKNLNIQYIVSLLFNKLEPASVMLHRLYATSPLMNFRPTAISDLRQLFIFVLFEG